MPTSGAKRLLSQAYRGLELTAGKLYKPATGPSSQTVGIWPELGDWLALASRMGADRLFFVDSDPLLVFSVIPDQATESDLVRTYRQAWSLSRPQCLFLASDDEIRVYDLSRPPPATVEQWRQLRPLEVVQRTADVAAVLANYHRERVESGDAFRNVGSNRKADQQLIQDVTTVAGLLQAAGLPAQVANTLIERAILVRYLEDRGVVTPDYIYDVASSRPEWVDALQVSADVPVFGAQSTFAATLGDKTLVYALFSQLSTDFNGDLFIVDEAEHQLVTSRHLLLLQQMLTGDTADQRPLFLWAYDFSVVPTSLISSLYENFYHSVESSSSASTGTHYTPPELVEFVLRRLLTDKVLDNAPRIIDPSCGSGVFLVEAYRMTVRNQAARLRRRLTSRELEHLLLTSVAGVDINAEAIRLAAFSLYLAFLNYQTPQDIRPPDPSHHSSTSKMLHPTVFF